MSTPWKPTGDDVVAGVITGAFSAWLWSRGMDQIGMVAPFLGAAIGLTVAYLCRSFC